MEGVARYPWLAVWVRRFGGSTSRGARLLNQVNEGVHSRGLDEGILRVARSQ